MKNIRLMVSVRGKVQGVGYRESTREVATEYNVYGWVRNEADGRVTAVLEGGEEHVLSVVEWMRSGPRHAQVGELTWTEEAYTGSFDSFAVQRTHNPAKV